MKKNVIIICVDGARLNKAQNSSIIKQFSPNSIFFTQAITYAPYTNSAIHALISGAYGNRNEGYSHGHALAFTTTAAHGFNNSIFYERFKKLVKKLEFDTIFLKQDFDTASETILKDKKHLDNNPIPVQKNDIIELLTKINSGKIFDNIQK